MDFLKQPVCWNEPSDSPGEPRPDEVASPTNYNLIKSMRSEQNVVIIESLCGRTVVSLTFCGLIIRLSWLRLAGFGTVELATFVCATGGLGSVGCAAMQAP